MNIQYKVVQIDTHPEKHGHQHVVSGVQWLMIATRSGFESISVAHSILPVDDLSQFTPVEQLTKEQLIAWAVASQGGQDWMDRMMEHHDMCLSMDEARAGTVPYTGQLSFALDAYPENNSLLADPQPE
jgi:hypothetical protein